MDLSRRKFVAGAGVAGAAALGAALTGCSGSSSPSSSSSSSSSAAKSDAKVGTDLSSMTWDQVLAEAKGQNVTFLAWGSGGADAFVQQWWNHLIEDVKSKYDINLTCVEQTTAETEKLVTDVTNGSDATYDLFWGLGSTMTQLRQADGIFKSWLSVMPNAQYYDLTSGFNTFDGTASVDDSEAGFQGLNPSLVYSKDSWSSDIAWDAAQGDVKGLFHNFSELAEWVKANPGKFTYMDLTGKGSFHGISFAKAALAELKSDGNGGWTPVYDESDSADARRKKIEANIEDWYKWSTSSEASEEAFIQRAGYLWAYLNEIAPNLLQGDGGPLYVPTAPEMMNYVKAGDLAVTFTTCTQVSNRVESAPDSYMNNPAIYMLNTSIGSWDYVVITSNSKNKAGALVIANEMMDPEQQLFAFSTTGNGYNVDYDKVDSSMQKRFDDAIESFGSLSSTAEAIADNSYTDKLGTVAKWLASGWASQVNGQ